MSTTIATNGTAIVANPFATSRPVAVNAGAESDNQRAIAEVQAAMVISQRFPRDQIVAMDRIIQAFTRPTLAESAMYSYARGGSDITGPSIRAAEAIAQAWGNIQHGVRELEKRAGESTVEAFAWDVESNVRSVKTFQVPHRRDTKKGAVQLTDARDIYELIANSGARRLRACILSIIPGDVVEAAMNQAETTLRTKVQITPELVQSLVDKFATIGVNKSAIETRIQRRIDAITPALVVQLGKIFNSVKDGMSAAEDWFETQAPSGDAPAPAASRLDQVRAKLEAQKQTQAADIINTPEPAVAPDAQPNEEPLDKIAEEPSAANDRKIRSNLRTEITNVWASIAPAARQNALKRRYNKASLPELTTAQLEDFLANSPTLIAEVTHA